MSEYFLGDVFDFINGGSWSESEYADSGIHVVKVTNMVNGGIITRPDDNYLPELKYDKYKAHKLEKNDILIATVGSHPTQQGSVVGRISLVLEKNAGSFLNQNAVCLRLKKYNLIDSIYFYHISKTIIFKWYIESRAKGSANQVRMALGDLKKFKHDYPEFKVQQAIAGILSAYDDLIENNKRRIALLENMAEELYREWFVRFRFPGWREAEFEKGIPKGWELQRVDSLGKVITGKTPLTSNEKYYFGNIHFIKTSDMHGNMFIHETEEKLTEDGLKSQPSQILPKNAISVSCIGTGGITSITTQRCCTNQQINSIVLKNENDLEWAFYTVKGLKETIYAFGSTGTTMTNLSKGKFSGLKFICAPKYLRDEYHMLTCPMFKEIQRLTQINNMLAKTKNALLPRLISGKLAVEDLAVQLPPSMRENV